MILWSFLWYDKFSSCYFVINDSLNYTWIIRFIIAETFFVVEIEAAISLLCEVCPTYFKMVEVRGEKYVHLKDNSFSAIRDIVNAEIKKCI